MCDSFITDVTTYSNSSKALLPRINKSNHHTWVGVTLALLGGAHTFFTIAHTARGALARGRVPNLHDMLEPGLVLPRYRLGPFF